MGLFNRKPKRASRYSCGLCRGILSGEYLHTHMLIHRNNGECYFVESKQALDGWLYYNRANSELIVHLALPELK